ncbi:hypothetical protein I7F13_09100 [Sinorhizobium meliloti]|uniref:hypothetical protein n=1 Tax=Rhizobium meliloti TaxID=382 RepID=UPI0013E3B2BC|nr:hypothetical protein [Sinorhizobium meliloti]MDE3822553.1 hypothetical protein [Sinorhizobium meliloti]
MAGDTLRAYRPTDKFDALTGAATTFSVEQRGGSLGTDNREDLTEGVVGSLGTHDRGLLFKLVYKWMVLNIHGQRENACKRLPQKELSDFSQL